MTKKRPIRERMGWLNLDQASLIWNYEVATKGRTQRTGGRGSSKDRIPKRSSTRSMKRITSNYLSKEPVDRGKEKGNVKKNFHEKRKQTTTKRNRVSPSPTAEDSRLSGGHDKELTGGERGREGTLPSMTQTQRYHVEDREKAKNPKDTEKWTGTRDLEKVDNTSHKTRRRPHAAVKKKMGSSPRYMWVWEGYRSTITGRPRNRPDKS